MTDAILEEYESWISKTRSGLLQGVFTLLDEIEKQLLGTSENYISVIIKGGKLYAAFAHVQNSTGPEKSVTKLDLHEFQDKEVNTTIPDSIVSSFFGMFEKIFKSKPNFVRILDAELLQSYVDFLSKYSGESNQYIPLNDLASIIIQWITAITTGKWTQYPDPPFCAFLKRSATQYANLPSTLIPFILKRLSIKQPTLFQIETSIKIIPFKLVPTPAGPEIVPITENIIRPVNWENFPDFLHNERVKYNTRSVFHVQLQPILDLLKEIVITPPPLPQERLNVILQRILHLFKDYGESWVTSPPPLTINNLFRFLTRAIGFNLNPRKVSYWYIPHAFRNFLVETTGGTGTLLCLYHQGMKVEGFLFKIENATIAKIEPISPDFLASIQSLVLESNQVPEKSKNIFHLACQTNINVTNVLYFSNQFFDVLFGRLPASFLYMRPLKVFSASGALKQLIDTRNFYMYPETAGFHYLRKLGGIKLLGWISRLFFDRHEF